MGICIIVNASIKIALLALNIEEAKIANYVKNQGSDAN